MKIEDLHIDFNVVCAKYGVEKVEVFGSFARGDADEQSDLDLIVKFAGLTNLVDRFFGFKYEIEALSNRPTDILPDKPLKNPVFSKNVHRDRRVIYG